MSRWTAPGLAGIAVAWLVLITVAPVLWIPVAGVVYAAGSLICHQLPERSFHLNTSQLPVCARCFGLYLGAAMGAVASTITIGRHAPATRLRTTRRSAWISTAVAAAPTAVTFVLEWGLGWSVSNANRAIAAVPLGAVVAFVVVNAVATIDS